MESAQCGGVWFRHAISAVGVYACLRIGFIRPDLLFCETGDTIENAAGSSFVTQTNINAAGFPGY